MTKGWGRFSRRFLAIFFVFALVMPLGSFFVPTRVLAAGLDDVRITNATAVVVAGKKQVLLLRFKLSNYPHKAGIEYRVRVVADGKTLKTEKIVSQPTGLDYSNEFYTIAFNDYRPAGGGTPDVILRLFHKSSTSLDDGTHLQSINLAKTPIKPNVTAFRAYEKSNSTGAITTTLECKIDPRAWVPTLRIQMWDSTDPNKSRHVKLHETTASSFNNTLQDYSAENLARKTVIEATARQFTRDSKLECELYDASGSGSFMGEKVITHSAGNGTAAISFTSNLDTVADSAGVKGAKVKIFKSDGTELPISTGAIITPKTVNLPLGPDEYSITYNKDGYAEKKLSDVKFTEPKTLSAVLLKDDNSQISIDVKTNPTHQGAEVFINNNKKGITPYSDSHAKDDTTLYTVSLRHGSETFSFDPIKLDQNRTFYYNFATKKQGVDVDPEDVDNPVGGTTTSADEATSDCSKYIGTSKTFGVVTGITFEPAKFVACQLINFTAWVVGGISQIFNALVQNPWEQISKPENGIITLWKVALGIIDLIVVAGLIVAAFANIFSFLPIKLDSYRIKQILPGIIMGIIMANLSFFIMRLLIESSHIVTQLIGEIVSGYLTGTGQRIGDSTVVPFLMNQATRELMDSILLNTPIPNATFEFKEGAAAQAGEAAKFVITGLGSAFLNNIFAPLTLILFLLLIIVALGFILYLAFLLYIRGYILIILFIASPIAFFSLSFPPMKKIWLQWWGFLIKWLAMLPVTFAIVGVAIIFLNRGNQILGTRSLMMYLFFNGAALVILYQAVTIPFKYGQFIGGFSMDKWKKYGEKGADYGKQGWKGAYDKAQEYKAYRKHGGDFKLAGLKVGPTRAGSDPFTDQDRQKEIDKRIKARVAGYTPGMKARNLNAAQRADVENTILLSERNKMAKKMGFADYAAAGAIGGTGVADAINSRVAEKRRDDYILDQKSREPFRQAASVSKALDKWKDNRKKAEERIGKKSPYGQKVTKAIDPQSYLDDTWDRSKTKYEDNEDVEELTRDGKTKLLDVLAKARYSHLGVTNFDSLAAHSFDLSKALGKEVEKNAIDANANEAKMFALAVAGETSEDIADINDGIQALKKGRTARKRDRRPGPSGSSASTFQDWLYGDPLIGPGPLTGYAPGGAPPPPPVVSPAPVAIASANTSFSNNAEDTTDVEHDDDGRKGDQDTQQSSRTDVTVSSPTVNFSPGPVKSLSYRWDASTNSWVPQGAAQVNVASPTVNTTNNVDVTVEPNIKPVAAPAPNINPGQSIGPTRSAASEAGKPGEDKKPAVPELSKEVVKAMQQDTSGGLSGPKMAGADISGLASEKPADVSPIEVSTSETAMAAAQGQKLSADQRELARDFPGKSLDAARKQIDKAEGDLLNASTTHPELNLTVENMSVVARQHQLLVANHPEKQMGEAADYGLSAEQFEGVKPELEEYNKALKGYKKILNVVTEEDEALAVPRTLAKSFDRQRPEQVNSFKTDINRAASQLERANIGELTSTQLDGIRADLARHMGVAASVSDPGNIRTTHIELAGHVRDAQKALAIHEEVVTYRNQGVPVTHEDVINSNRHEEISMKQIADTIDSHMKAAQSSGQTVSMREIVSKPEVIQQAAQIIETRVKVDPVMTKMPNVNVQLDSSQVNQVAQQFLKPLADTLDKTRQTSPETKAVNFTLDPATSDSVKSLFRKAVTDVATAVPAARSAEPAGAEVAADPAISANASTSASADVPTRDPVSDIPVEQTPQGAESVVAPAPETPAPVETPSE